MRITYISGSLLPSTQASGVNVMKMCSALARLGHEVTLFGRKAGPVGPREVFDHYGVAADFTLRLIGGKGLPGSKNVLYPLAVGWHLWRLPAPDLFYGRQVFALRYAARWRPNVPIAYEAHAIPSKKARRAAEEWLFRQPQFLTNFVISRALGDDYREWMHDRPELDIQLAPDAADAPSGPVAAKSNLGGRPGAQQVGYVGHLYPGKGMEVVAALAQRLPEVDFHVVGGTRGDLDTWRTRSQGQANLHFHGFVPHAEVQSYLAAFDVVLVPPQPSTQSAAGRDIGRWMSPLKIFDSMAARRPIIASDIPAVREILSNDETALLAGSDDIDGWVSALRSLRDPQRARRLADAAYAALIAEHTWLRRAERVMQHLDQRLHERRARAGVGVLGHT